MMFTGKLVAYARHFVVFSTTLSAIVNDVVMSAQYVCMQQNEKPFRFYLSCLQIIKHSCMDTNYKHDSAVSPRSG